MNTNQKMNSEKYEAYLKATHRLGRAVSMLTLVMLLGAPFLIGGLLGTMPDIGARYTETISYEDPDNERLPRK